MNTNRNKILHLLLFWALASIVSCKSDSANTNPPPVVSDSTSTSPHQYHAESYKKHSVDTEAEWDSIQGISHENKHIAQSELDPRYKTFGWHLAGEGTAYRSYSFPLLWGVGYFSYEVNAATGSYKTIGQWKTTALIDSAKKHGTKVFLTCTSFGGNSNHAFLSNPTAIQTFTDSVIALVDLRDADGVCLDFESVHGSDRAAFTSFLTGFSKALKSENPDFQLSLALYAVDWNKVFEIEKIKESIDLFMVMGYDYYYAGSPNAGPVAPLQSGTEWTPYNLEKSVDYYLGQGLPKEKLLLSLPYYGRQWRVESTDLNAATVKGAGSKAPAIRIITQDYNRSSAQENEVSKSEWLNFSENNLKYQLWYDDTTSLGAKYDFAKEKGIGGIAIWALGYDNGLTEYWKLIEDKFGKKKED